MADNEEGEGNPTRTNEWEVVSLTASAYAAAPGLEQPELNDNDEGNTVEEAEAETSQAMFMSGHFVSPASRHENFPLQPENVDIQKPQGIDDIPEFGAEEDGKSDTKDGEGLSLTGLAGPDEFPGIQFTDEKDNRLSIHETELKEETTLNLTEKEHDVYGASKFSSFHCEANIDESSVYDENRVITGQIEPSDGGLDSDISQLPKPANKDKDDSSELPCEAWWKKQAASLYAQAKEANTFWSIFIAATMMGLVILGQRWQQERWQVLQLKRQIAVSDEKMGRMLGPLSRFKDAIVGVNRRGSSISGSSSANR